MDTSGSAAPAPFGQHPGGTPAPNPFAQASNTAPAFGPRSTASGFGGFGGTNAAGAANTMSQAVAAPPMVPGGAAAASGSGPYGPGATRQHPAADSYTSRDGTGALRTFKGKPVTYQPAKDGKPPFPALRNFDGSFARIWFPDGPPLHYKDTELEDGAYDARTREAYEAFMKTGRFAGGMPELPPRREWCMFDF